MSQNKSVNAYMFVVCYSQLVVAVGSDKPSKISHGGQTYKKGKSIGCITNPIEIIN